MSSARSDVSLNTSRRVNSSVRHLSDIRGNAMFLSYILILITPFLVVARQEPQLPKLDSSNQNIEFRIYPHKPTVSASSISYRAGGSIKVRCVWRNAGKNPTALDLVDRDDYHKTNWPPMMSARITDAQGHVLTNNEYYAEGWWTSYLSGGFIRENLITLKPGEELTRVVPLDKILLRAPKLPGGLKAGTYFIELSLGELVSNKVEIKVVAKE
jgi:hypothetical protein